MLNQFGRIDIKTPIEHFHRLTLELDTSVTDLMEGEWVSPSVANGNLYVRTGSGTAAPNVAFISWLDMKRPDSVASALQGSGTIASPFGKVILLTDMFQRFSAPGVAITYANGDQLTAKIDTVVGSVTENKAVLTKAAPGDAIVALCVSKPTGTGTGARIKIAIL